MDDVHCMWWIGITGPMGSGKSTVCEAIKEAHYPIVQADELAKQAVSLGSPALKKLVAEFGSEILDSTGLLNRKKFAEKIFSQPKCRIKAEEIIHPEVQALVQGWRNERIKEGCHFGFYEIPLLFEKKLEGQFDKIICIYSNQSDLVKRVKERDHLSEKEILDRLNNQLDVNVKIQNSDYLIENNGTVDELKVKVFDLLKA